MTQAHRRLIPTVAMITFWSVTAAAQGPAPYVDPPFAGECTVHHYDEGEAPPIDLPDEPMCVEYEKRDITGTNGGAIRFLAAEPARFALAIPKCRYWQQDHWRIQLAPGDTPIVGWDGSYWFDKGSGSGAARLRNFTIAGIPADAGQLADLIAPLDADLAAVIRTYGDGPSGGGGASFCLGFADPTCASAPCTNPDPCACAVAETRRRADAACDCAGATNHGDYVRCVTGVADEDVAAGRLPRECRRNVTRCASRSTCGKPGFTTCCRTNSRGETSCHLKREGRCKAPRGGRACEGARSSCCDACTASGCTSPPAPDTCS